MAIGPASKFTKKWGKKLAHLVRMVLDIVALAIGAAVLVPLAIGIEIAACGIIIGIVVVLAPVYLVFSLFSSCTNGFGG